LSSAGLTPSTAHPSSTSRAIDVETPAELLKYVFGPVPSRRLGLSLGVDLVALKTCTYDCVYCQIGRTSNRTVERRVYNPVEEVLRDIRTALERGPTPDYVTLSGSGEPTLHSGFGEVIRGVKGFSDVPVALLTNGSLFFDAQVREAALQADLVLPSLDAGDEATFQRVNRPHSALTLAQVVEGLVDFRREFAGAIWLEVFLVAGMTDTPEAVAKMKRLADRIKPDKIQLNTAVRPTAERYVCGVGKDRLEELAGIFEPPGEVIASFPRHEVRSRFVADRQKVLALLRRRPCTVEDVAYGLEVHLNEAIKHLTDLAEAGLIERERRAAGEYFKAV